MNEDMAAGTQCYRLLKHWEKGPKEVDGVPWPRSKEGAALKAYQCSANKWTISFGVRWHPDGRPVKQGDTITEDHVMPYLEAAMGRVCADVRRVVTAPMTQNQMDAVIVFVYNLGIGNLKASTQLLPAINASRWDDAATEMGAFVYSTTTKDGKPWKRALRGLLARRYTEALTMMNYDWEVACADVALPVVTEWEEEKGRYYDRVLPTKTRFKDVLAIAQRYPLPALPEPADAVLFDPAPTLAPAAKPASAATPDSPTAQPAAPRVEEPAAGPPVPNPTPAQAAPAKVPAASTSGPDAAGKSAPQAPPVAGPTTVPPPVVAGQDGAKPIHRETKMPDGVPYGVDLKAGAKPMEATERFVGSAMMWVANALRVGAANGMKATGFLGFAIALFLDMMKSPVTAALILSTILAAICFVVWLFGFILEKTGLKKKKAGERSASQLMY